METSDIESHIYSYTSFKYSQNLMKMNLHKHAKNASRWVQERSWQSGSISPEYAKDPTFEWEGKTFEPHFLFADGLRSWRRGSHPAPARPPSGSHYARKNGPGRWSWVARDSCSSLTTYRAYSPEECSDWCPNQWALPSPSQMTKFPCFRSMFPIPSNKKN